VEPGVFYGPLLVQLTEALTCQRLRQNVDDLLLSTNMFDVHLPISNTLSNEMKSHIYVFALIVEDMILTECYTRLAIHLEKKGCALLVLQFDEQPC
jgi:hypothetical protein